MSFRVAFAVNGTRGDFQPYLSLAVGLRKAGHIVKFFTASSHARVAKEFDFEAESCSNDVEEVLKKDACRRSMEESNFFIVAQAMEDLFKSSDPNETDEQRDKRYLDSLQAFKPDLILFNSIGGMAIRDAWKGERGYPWLNIELQPQACASDEHVSSAFNKEFPDPDTPNIMSYFWTLPLTAATQAHNELRDKNLSKEDYITAMREETTPEQLFEDTFEADKGPQPRYMAYSPAFWPNPEDWPKTDLIRVLGNFKLDKESQAEFVEKGLSFFTSGSLFQECEEFLERGAPPVYIGWGSMVVYGQQHMTLLAVRAVKLAGERAIILGGWAKLGIEGLDGAEDEEELRAYCKENVIFMKMAPHELIFPRCKACVHHGGIGTLQASLSNGCPTIITPVFADQFCNAQHLVKTGCGLETTRLGALKTEELGKAIKKICSDESFMEKTTALARKMQQEDGVGSMIKDLTAFMNDEVRTGKWSKAVDDRLDRLYEARKKAAKLNPQQIQGKMTAVLQRKYPSVQAWNGKNMAFFATAVDLLSKGKLWVVCGSSALAREGDGLKTPEVGRFKKHAFLEEINKKGSRIHMKRLRGRGPDKGWITPKVSDKDMVYQLTDPSEIGAVQAQEFMDLFN